MTLGTFIVFALALIIALLVVLSVQLNRTINLLFVIAAKQGYVEALKAMGKE